MLGSRLCLVCKYLNEHLTAVPLLMPPPARSTPQVPFHGPHLPAARVRCELLREREGLAGHGRAERGVSSLQGGKGQGGDHGGLSADSTRGDGERRGVEVRCGETTRQAPLLLRTRAFCGTEVGRSMPYFPSLRLLL